MKRSITVAFADEELLELQRIILDDDREEALRFLNRYFKDKVKGVLEGEGHCRPYFEVQARNNLLEGLQPPGEGQHAS